MRIVTWNCASALRKKTEAVDALDADILVIQECEDPRHQPAEFQAWAGLHLWSGSNRNKGLGIFARKGLSLTPLEWREPHLEHFLVALVDGMIPIIAVWTKKGSQGDFQYIGQFWQFLRHNQSLFTEQAIICGDLNSNKIWDKRGRRWNHSECLAELSKLGFESLYHLNRGEDQGQESTPTFYLQRNIDKPYHIDYGFAHRSLCESRRPSLAIGDPDTWLKLSDHMPLIIDF